MITLADLARLAIEHAAGLEHPVVPLRIGARVADTDERPVLMGW